MIAIFDEAEEGCIQNTVNMRVVELFSGKFEIEIPEDMQKMPENVRKINYPYKYRPENIWWNPHEECHITLQLLPERLKQEEIYDATIAVAHLMKEHNPRLRIGQVHLFKERQKIGWFVMDIGECKKRKRHMKFVTEMEGKFILGTITYPEELQDMWTALIKHIFSSITIKGGFHDKSNERGY